MRIGLPAVIIRRLLLFSEQPKSAAVGGCGVRNRAWNPQFHLRARSELAPYIECRAYLLGALAHAGQAPVSVTSRAQEPRVYALAIVPDSQPEKALPVSNLRFDFA